MKKPAGNHKHFMPAVYWRGATVDIPEYIGTQIHRLTSDQISLVMSVYGARILSSGELLKERTRLFGRKTDLQVQ